MSKNLKRLTQNEAKDEKSCLEEPSRKTTRLEHITKNIFKSLTNPVNQNSPEFVMLNKKATFEKLNGKVFDKVKDFEKQGFLFLCLNILYLKYCKL